ncbi:hypothetical protein LY76DRAFT_115670 [Colletotrichum caudatum]|nr:hypothetical protein LY76DRAFT_115670 [Colletotrichum caudatum]
MLNLAYSLGGIFIVPNRPASATLPGKPRDTTEKGHRSMYDAHMSEPRARILEWQSPQATGMTATLPDVPTFFFLSYEAMLGIRGGSYYCMSPCILLLPPLTTLTQPTHTSAHAHTHTRAHTISRGEDMGGRSNQARHGAVCCPWCSRISRPHSKSSP